MTFEDIFTEIFFNLFFENLSSYVGEINAKNNASDNNFDEINFFSGNGEYRKIYTTFWFFTGKLVLVMKLFFFGK